MGRRQGQLVGRLTTRALAGALVFLLTHAPLAQAARAQAGVVFQISSSSPFSWKIAVRNARNLLNAMGDQQVRIEMVVFGPALKMLLKSSPVAHNILALHRTGVSFEACKSALLKDGLPPQEILPVVRFIPSSIAEVVRRQREGWSYIEP